MRSHIDQRENETFRIRVWNLYLSDSMWATNAGVTLIFQRGKEKGRVKIGKGKYEREKHCDITCWER